MTKITMCALTAVSPKKSELDQKSSQMDPISTSVVECFHWNMIKKYKYISCCLLLDLNKKKKALYLLYFYCSNPGGQGSTLQYLCVPVYKYIYLMFFFKYCPILCILMLYCLNLTHTYHHFFVHFLHSINICNLL